MAIKNGEGRFEIRRRPVCPACRLLSRLLACSSFFHYDTLATLVESAAAARGTEMKETRDEEKQQPRYLAGKKVLCIADFYLPRNPSSRGIQVAGPTGPKQAVSQPATVLERCSLEEDGKPERD